MDEIEYRVDLIEACFWKFWITVLTVLRTFLEASDLYKTAVGQKIIKFAIAECKAVAIRMKALGDKHDD